MFLSIHCTKALSKYLAVCLLPFVSASIEQQQEFVHSMTPVTASRAPTLQLGTTVVYGTTLVTETYGPDGTTIPSVYPGISGAELRTLDASSGYLFATYRAAEPTTFILPPSPAPWRIQFRTTIVLGPSGVNINYHNPYLNSIITPTRDVRLFQTALNPEPSRAEPVLDVSSMTNSVRCVKLCRNF